MAYTTFASLSYLPRGGAKRSLRSKYSWMDNLRLREKKVYKSTSPVVMKRIRQQGYKFNRLNLNKKLSCRQLQAGGFAVIRIL